MTKNLNKMKYKLEEIIFLSKWKRTYKNKLKLRGDIIFCGIGRTYFNPKQFTIKICFFGFEMHIWIIKNTIK